MSEKHAENDDDDIVLKRFPVFFSKLETFRDFETNYEVYKTTILQCNPWSVRYLQTSPLLEN